MSRYRAFIRDDDDNEKYIDYIKYELQRLEAINKIHEKMNSTKKERKKTNDKKR